MKNVDDLSAHIRTVMMQCDKIRLPLKLGPSQVLIGMHMMKTFVCYDVCGTRKNIGRHNGFVHFKAFSFLGWYIIQHLRVRQVKEQILLREIGAIGPVGA